MPPDNTCLLTCGLSLPIGSVRWFRMFACRGTTSRERSVSFVAALGNGAELVLVSDGVEGCVECGAPRYHDVEKTYALNRATVALGFVGRQLDRATAERYDRVARRSRAPYPDAFQQQLIAEGVQCPCALGHQRDVIVAWPSATGPEVWSIGTSPDVPPQCLSTSGPFAKVIGQTDGYFSLILGTDQEDLTAAAHAADRASASDLLGQPPLRFLRLRGALASSTTSSMVRAGAGLLLLELARQRFAGEPSQTRLSARIDAVVMSESGTIRELRSIDPWSDGDD